MSIKHLQLSKARHWLLLLFVLPLLTARSYAYDFSAVCETGQTLYYNIIDAANHKVELTCPNYYDWGHGDWDGFEMPKGDILLPETVEYDGIAYSVTSIGDYAFCDCSGLTGSLVIPNSVTSIGTSAFVNCWGLTGSLVIPNSVTSIGASAFDYCQGFSGSLVIPNSVLTIGEAAFNWCDGFTSLSLGSSLTSIGSRAFWACMNFHGSLVIPNSVETIGESAFGYNNFTSLSLGNSLTTIEAGTFSYCNSFSGSLVIPNSVETIGGDAFCGCEGFRSLSLGNSLTSIGNGAFESCRNLSGSLIIPNSVTTIGDYAFCDCEGLTCLSLGNSLTSIGFNAFSDCSRLVGPLVIPNSVTTIGENSFADCFGLASLTIGNSVTSIGSYAFQNCGFSFVVSKAAVPPALEDACFGDIIPDVSVQVPCGTTEAYSLANGWNEFGNYSEFRNFEIDVLASDAVMGSVALVQLPDCETGIATVEATAVQGCEFVNWTENGEQVSADATYSFEATADRKLVANFVPAGIPVVIAAMANPTEGGTIIGAGTYNQMETVTLTAVPDLGYEFDYWSENDVWVSDEQTFAFAAVVDRNLVAKFREVAYNFSEVCSTGQTLYYWISDAQNHKVAITSPNNNYYSWNGYEMPAGEIVLPETVEHDEVTYTVTAIRNYAFYECSDLTGSLVIPNTVTSIGDYAFSDCSGFIGDLVIPNSVTSIGDYAFSDCSGFDGSLTLSASLQEIGGSAFSYCSGFNGSLTLSASLQEIGSWAFYECSGFTGDLVIPNAVTSIEDHAFAYCSGFNGTLTLSTSLQEIGSSAFDYCSGFTGDLVIPNSVTSIGSSAFYGCTGFNGSLTIGNSVTSIGNYAFRGCNGFTGQLTIGNSVASMGKYVFCDCRSFTGDLVIPNSVTAIGEWAFYNLNRITGLTIGKSVTSIGNYAFYGCSRLSSITSKADVPPVLGNSCFNVSIYISVYVPCGTSAVYRLTSGWSRFIYFSELSTLEINLLASEDIMGSVAIIQMPDCEDDVAIVEATANPGCEFVNWTENGVEVSTDATYSFETTEDRSLVANFRLTGIPAVIAASAFPAEGGTVTGAGTYQQMETVTLTAIPNLSYELDYWSENDEWISDDQTITFTAVGDRNLVANFKEVAYSFSEICSTGQTLYYWIFDAPNHKVALTSPNGNDPWGWEDYEMPAGEIVLPETVEHDGIIYTVTSIRNCAFYDCCDLTGSLVIPASVTSIGEEAFYNCSGFNGTLTLPNSLQEIGDWAFEDCSGFTGDLTIPNSVTSIGEEAFYYCIGFNGTLTLPNSLQEIGNWAFEECSGLTGDLTIPNSVTSIGEGAFYYCNGLTGSLIIPNLVGFIGDFAFGGNGFSAIAVDSDNPYYYSEGNAVIRKSDKILTIGCKNTIIPNDVSGIGDYAFYGCSGFTGDLVIPNSVTSIGYYAFGYCSGFTGDLTIPSSVTTIGGYAFYGCSGFTGDLTIPSSVTTIGGYAFYGCSGFNGTLTLPNSLQEIGYCAFEECSGFTGDLVIPNSITSIGSSAFYNCSGFNGTLTLPNSLQEIWGWAFGGCSGFTGDLAIPNAVTSIGDYAFYYCSGFTGDLVIPNAVTSIEDYAFYGCSGLSSIISKTNVPPALGRRCFYNVPQNIPVYVQCGTSEAYQQANGWNVFNNYLEIWLREIEVSSSDEIMGSVAIIQMPDCEDDVAIVEATANPGYELVNWAENNEVVSADATYSFEATEDRSLVAVFRLSSALVFIGSETDHSWSTASNWNTNALPVETDDVFINGICELDGSATVASLTVNAGKSVTVKNGNALTVTGMLATTDVSQLLIEDGGQLVHNNDALATVQKTIDGYTGSNDNYYLIASPITDNTSVANLTSDAYDLYTFDQSEELEWRNQHENAAVAHKGGYLYANSGNVTLEFAGSVASSAEATHLDYVAGNDFSGFNLIGNPFPCNAYIENSYLRMNEGGTALEAGSGAIAPCEAVFVEATGENQSVDFSKTVSRVDAINISVSKNRGTCFDRAIVRFDGKSDLHKMTLHEGEAKLYIPQFGEDFASVSSQTNEGEIPVSFKAAKNGTYTINVDMENVEATYLHLIDNLTGADTDLLATPSYSFDAKTNDYASRFKLVFGMKDVESAEVSHFAFISNGNLVIENIEGQATLQIIDVLGRVVSSEIVSGSYSKAHNLKSGLYLINLDGMTQKIVVK